MMKMQLGVQEGIDENATIVLVTMPPDDNGFLPTLMLLIPVTDYDKFLKPLQPGSASDGVTKIKLLNIPAYAGASAVTRRWPTPTIASCSQRR